MFLFFILFLIIFSSLINIAFLKKQKTFINILEIVLLYFFVFQVGFMGLLAGLGHIFNGPETAKMIGWLPGSPFQYEVGVMNLGISVLGFLCIWFRREFWLATSIIYLVIMFGCGVGHIREMLLKGNLAPYNAGPGIIMGDMVIPLLIFVLLIIYRSLKKD